MNFNKHGLEWTGGPMRLMKTKNTQGQFGSLRDIQFAVERGAELGPKGEGFFALPPTNSSFVYVFKDGIVDGETITLPAQRVFVKVRADGLIHAYPALAE